MHTWHRCHNMDGAPGCIWPCLHTCLPTCPHTCLCTPCTGATVLIGDGMHLYLHECMSLHTCPYTCPSASAGVGKYQFVLKIRGLHTYWEFSYYSRRRFRGFGRRNRCGRILGFSQIQKWIGRCGSPALAFDRGLPAWQPQPLLLSRASDSFFLDKIQGPRSFSPPALCHTADSTQNET